MRSIVADGFGRAQLLPASAVRIFPRAGVTRTEKLCFRYGANFV